MLRKRFSLLLLLILGVIAVLSFLHPNIYRVHLDVDPSIPGYVIALRYSGQQGAGMKALLSLQRWVRDVRLPMKIVEPFIVKSVLGAFKNSAAQEFKFSDLFDLAQFNDVSRSEGVAELISWDTYVAQAPSNAVLVKFIIPANRTSPVPSPKVVWSVQPGREKCWKGEYFPKIKHFKINYEKLCFVRVVIAHFRFLSSHTISSDEVCRYVLSGLDPSNCTLVFNLWRGPWKVFDPLLPPPASCRYYSDRFNYHFIRNESALFIKEKLKESPRLLRDIKSYQGMFLNRSAAMSYIAVMLRAEHAVLRNWRNKNLNDPVHTQLRHCLDEAAVKAESIMKELGTQDVFVTADIGIYGSHSWSKTMGLIHSTQEELATIRTEIKDTVSRLYRKKWMLDEWEKTFSLATGGLDDSGYVAALQRGVASKASCLVLLGGGSFQTLALDNYLNRNKSCVHYVCIDKIGSRIN